MDKLERGNSTESKMIKFLMKALFFFIHLAVMTEIVANPKFRHVIKLIFFVYISRPYYKTIKQRYYTYWTFSTLLIIYLLFKINEQFYNLHQPHIGILYFISTLILIWKMFLLSSPIYYPRVNWWEFDFRYRDDLKIQVKIGEQNFEARLTDLRRHAGCLAIFEDVHIGSDVIISATVEDESVNLRGIVMSKRRELIGRPYIYGVEFKFDNRRNKKRYSQLKRLWTIEKKNKKKIKFANVIKI